MLLPTLLPNRLQQGLAVEMEIDFRNWRVLTTNYSHQDFGFFTDEWTHHSASLALRKIKICFYIFHIDSTTSVFTLIQ